MTRTATLALAAFFGATIIACATPDLLSGEFSTTGWLESDVNGIRVLTNSRPETARRSLRKLARFLLLARAVGGHELPSEPITLQLFERQFQYQAFAGSPMLAGHTMSTD